MVWPFSSTGMPRRKGKSSKAAGRKAVLPKAPTTEHLGGSEVGWLARGDFEAPEKRVPFTKPKIRQIYHALPFIWRYSFFWLKNFRRREKLFINTYQPLKHKTHYGVPCGGIGAGSIGRDFRGAFCKFSLSPGVVEQRAPAAKADQFILNVSRDGKTLRQVCLSAAFVAGASPLIAWDFGLPADCIAYRGLYPRAWTRFDLPDLGLTVTCRQVTPVIPHNYVDSSLPTTVFVFEVHNDTDQAYDVSITFTFRNGTGKKKYNAKIAECKTSMFETNSVTGALLDHEIDETRCIYAIGARPTDSHEAFVCTGFDPTGSGRAFWTALSDSCGRLDAPIDGQTTGAVAVSLATSVAGRGSSGAMEFNLTWHMPNVSFGKRKRVLTRWYARHFGSDPESAQTIAEHALTHYQEWETKIDDWQRPVLEHPNLPTWFKSALFNELYFITDGGSMWFDYDDAWLQQEKHLSDYTVALLKEYGRFGYLESWEYRMVNTYDVHFYASSALAELFPKLEHVMQAEMSDNIHHSEDKLIRFHMEGDYAPRKTVTRMPHDLGNPSCEPWLATNAYAMHNTAMWKDLNLKYVLTSYRDYAVMLKRDPAFLAFVWPTVKCLIEVGLASWDCDGDGMIENFGLADQTYDAWRMEGVSAYCGSLWLGALRAAVEMARDVEDTEAHTRYEKTLAAAKAVFEAKLWNGKYYNFDESRFSKATIMADQLCGYWYIQSVDPDLVKDLLPEEHVRSALNTVYEYNVMKFGNGRLGAVNGMKPDGRVDDEYIQADEVWTGITYALGAFYLQQREPQRGFDVAFGVYDTCFNRAGLQYQTPEAIYRKKCYRAIGYMRPLAIWSMYSTLRRYYGIKSGIDDATPDPVCVARLENVRTTDPVPSTPGDDSDSSEDVSSESGIDVGAGGSSLNTGELDDDVDVSIEASARLVVACNA